MTIEKLTEDQRYYLDNFCSSEGHAALRIINAHEAESAALRAELAEARQLKEAADRDAHFVEIELAEARASLDRVRALRDTHAHQARGSVFSTALVGYLDEALTADPVSPRAWGAAAGQVRPDCGHEQPPPGVCPWCEIDARAATERAVGDRCVTCDQRLDASDERDAYHSALLDGELARRSVADG